MAENLRAFPVDVAGMFGWLHPAKGALRTPVLLCAPFGLEALASGAGWRILAERLAAQGHPTLRFDYPGTGNSPGEALAPDRLNAWQAGVTSAIDALKTASGQTKILIVGLRLGAMLAALGAQNRDDIAGLALLAPVISGRRYARQLTASARLMGDAGAIENGIVAQGFEIAKETLQALGALDLARLPAPGTPGLLLARNEEEAALASTWGLAQAPFEGLEAFIENPTHVRLPENAFATLLAWCAGQPLPLGSGLGVPLPPARFMLATGEEDAVSFGPQQSLFGIISKPHARANSLGVILLNAGRNPLSGWGRQGVELARALSAQGHVVLRMDAHGIGDSPRAPDGPDEILYSPEQVEDLRAGVAQLQQTGVERIYLVGACSGAYLALQGSLVMPEIVGFALINLLKFHWHPGDSLDVAEANAAFKPTQAYRKRLFQAETWLRMFRGEVDAAGIFRALILRALDKARRPFETAFAGLGLMVSPRREALGWFRDLSARGCDIMLINAEEDTSQVELARYFGPEGRDLAGIAGVHRHVIGAADHNFSPPPARETLRALVREALRRLA